MRKAQKEQAENFIKLLEQVHEEIRKFWGSGDRAAVKELLGQCQEGAVELGNFIEKAEGEGIEIISLLEDYCELVYQIYAKIDEEKGMSVEEIWAELRQQLHRIENELKYKIKTRYEIVFMPYKSSMWDSLESVWKAACEDKNCNVYVVPVPYYDRNADRSLGEFHYEGGDFPKNVSVIHYSAYNLEKRRPDVIYIHNPYDDDNSVTSIAPQFYSHKLKECTDCLVYIPYCVYEEREDPGCPETIEYCEHYITDGVRHADKVILQSEKFRQMFISTLLACGDMDRQYWENRILGLGSPKYDRIADTERDKEQIPESWKRIIRKPDGGRKKVIFYNTGLGSLWRKDREVFRKMRSVFQFFYEKRDEYALLWRPHPLALTTAGSIRPEFKEEYKEIVDTYREGQWGIYDDTSDFHMAFALSDAYYGDYSSLVLLYQETGKPLLEQNISVLKYGKRLAVDKLYYDGDYLWGTAREFNGLFRVEPETYRVQYMGQFPGEKAERYRLFQGIVEYNGKLYFLPYCAENIAVYDKEQANFYTIPLGEDIKNIDKKFCRILVHGKNIYLLGSRAHVIIRLNTESGEITCIESWVKKVREHNTDRSEGFIRSGCICGDDLYCLNWEGTALFHMELKDLSCECISMKRKGNRSFSEIIEADGLLWLIPRKEGFVSCFDPASSIRTELAEMNRVRCACKAGEYLYCFLSNEPIFYRVNTRSKETTAFQMAQSIYAVWPADDKIFMTTYASGELCVLDTETLGVTKSEMWLKEEQLPDLDIRELWAENKKHNRYAREFGFLDLKYLCEKSITDGITEHDLKDKNCGSKIHNYVKGVIEN